MDYKLKQYTDSKGKLIGVQQLGSPDNILLVHSKNTIEIEIKQAENNLYKTFIWRNPESKIVRNVPMRLVIEDGEKIDGNYIYRVQ